MIPFSTTRTATAYRDIIDFRKQMLSKSAANGYRTVDTTAAVIDSPLFRKK